MNTILNDNILHIDIKEVSREELIKTFEILYEKKLINQNELQHAISIANEKYKSIKNLTNIESI